MQVTEGFSLKVAHVISLLFTYPNLQFIQTFHKHQLQISFPSVFSVPENNFSTPQNDQLGTEYRRDHLLSNYGKLYGTHPIIPNNLPGTFISLYTKLCGIKPCQNQRYKRMFVHSRYVHITSCNLFTIPALYLFFSKLPTKIIFQGDKIPQCKSSIE